MNRLILLCPIQKIQQPFFFEKRQPLTFVAQNDQVVAGLDIKDFSRFGRDHDLTFFSYFNQAKDMLSSRRNAKTQVILGLVVHQLVYTHIENLRQKLALVNIRKGLPRFPHLKILVMYECLRLLA